MSLAGHIKRARKWLALLPVPSQLHSTPYHSCTLPCTFAPQNPKPDLKWSGKEGQDRTFPTFFSIFSSEPKLERSWAKPKKHQILLQISKRVVLALSKKKEVSIMKKYYISLIASNYD